MPQLSCKQPPALARKQHLAAFSSAVPHGAVLASVTSPEEGLSTPEGQWQVRVGVGKGPRCGWQGG